MDRGLRHLALKTRDLERTERFFVDILGLAREHLSAAITRFAAMGMAMWVERARADLEATG